jgi:hypothetical protein
MAAGTICGDETHPQNPLLRGVLARRWLAKGTGKELPRKLRPFAPSVVIAKALLAQLVR